MENTFVHIELYDPATGTDGTIAIPYSAFPGMATHVFTKCLENVEAINVNLDGDGGGTDVDPNPDFTLVTNTEEFDAAYAKFERDVDDVYEGE